MRSPVEVRLDPTAFRLFTFLQILTFASNTLSFIVPGVRSTEPSIRRAIAVLHSRSLHCLGSF